MYGRINTMRDGVRARNFHLTYRPSVRSSHTTLHEPRGIKVSVRLCRSSTTQWSRPTSGTTARRSGWNTSYRCVFLSPAAPPAPRAPAPPPFQSQRADTTRVRFSISSLADGGSGSSR